jgi:hypothetical protein
VGLLFLRFVIAPHANLVLTISFALYIVTRSLTLYLSERARARQEIARDGGRRRAAQTKAHLAAHPEDAAKIERQLLAEFEQEMARARARLDALKGRRPS